MCGEDRAPAPQPHRPGSPSSATAVRRPRRRPEALSWCRRPAASTAARGRRSRTWPLYRRDDRRRCSSTASGPNAPGLLRPELRPPAAAIRSRHPQPVPTTGHREPLCRAATRVQRAHAPRHPARRFQGAALTRERHWSRRPRERGGRLWSPPGSVRVGNRRGGAEFVPGLALGGRQKRHHGQGQSGEHDAGDGPLGLSGARERQDGVDGDVRGEREGREGDDP